MPISPHTVGVFDRLPSLEDIQQEWQSRQATKERKEQVTQYYGSPSLFAQECIQWPPDDDPTDYQLLTWDSLVQDKRVAVRGPHGLGKSAIAAILVHWFALTRDAAGQDWKIPTTASAWRQLTKFLWPEIHKWARRIKWWKVGRDPYDPRHELLHLELKLKHGQAFAVASNIPDLIEGAHADQLLYIFDESKYIPFETFDAAEGAFSGGGIKGREAYGLSVSTPGPPSGRFYDIHSKKPGFEDWKTLHITLAQAIAAGRITQKWADDRKRQWGEKSPIYQNRVLGEFAESEEISVIPLSWVEVAQERWLEWADRGETVVDLTSVGIDVARFGDDRSTMAFRKANIVPEIRSHGKKDTMETAGLARSVLSAYAGVGIVDIIGIGAGVFDRLREQHVPVYAFNGAAKAAMLVNGELVDITDRSGELKFQNMRAAAWWHLRELLDPELGMSLALPPDDEENHIFVTGDLTAPTWKTNSTGKIQIEEKEAIKMRINRSPDCGDAIVEAFALEYLDGIQQPWELWSVGSEDARAEEESNLERYVKQHGVFWPNAVG